MPPLSGRLLVVDDDADSRDLLARRLRSNGHTVTEADSGRKALDLLNSEEFELILLDVMMPGVDGFDVLGQIRESRSLVDLPVIMVTARDSSVDMVEGLRKGANDYLTKPIDFAVALARIQTHLLLNTLKRDLQVEKEFSDSLIRSAYEMIISVDLDRNITQFNPAAERTFGFTKEEILGQSVELLYADPGEGRRVHEVTLRENGFSGEVQNRRKDGKSFISSLSASVLYDKRGDPIGLMGISVDITDQKEFEQRQKEIERLKTDFLAIASHDLKNPLTGVKGYAILLRDLLSKNPNVDEETVQFTDRIQSLAEVMQKIVEDFLDFQALQDGQVSLSFEAASLNGLASAAGEDNSEYARSKNISIDYELDANDPKIRADKDRISQVVHNLVNNAVKFGNRNGKVIIRTRDEGKTAALEVWDDGPGIHHEEMGKLFVKYARLSTRPTGGEKSSGLGLAISRMLIDLHDGEIGARNNPEKGMTFWIRVPKSSS